VFSWQSPRSPCSHLSRTAATLQLCLHPACCLLDPELHPDPLVWLHSDLPPPHGLAQHSTGLALITASRPDTDTGALPACPAATLGPCSTPSRGCSAVLKDVRNRGFGARPQSLFQYFGLFASRKLLGVWQRFLIILTWCFSLHFKNVISCPVIQCRQNTLYSSLHYLH